MMHKLSLKQNAALYRKWFIDEGNKMGVEILDEQYGKSLEEILTTPIQLESSKR